MKGSGGGKEIRTNNLPCSIARMLGGFARRRCRPFRIMIVVTGIRPAEELAMG